MADANDAPDIPAVAVVEATGRRVTVEAVDGATYSGQLVNFDMCTSNIELVDVKCQARDSSLSICERMLLRGDQIRMVHLPAEVQKAPMLDWRNEGVQQALKKALRPKRRVVKRAVVKSDGRSKKKKDEKKLKKLR